MKNPFKKNSLKPEVATALTVFIVLIIFWTSVYHFMEGWSWITSLYFVVYTLSTVGYGDVVPTTDLSRLVTVAFILTGVTAAVGSLSVIGSKYIEKRSHVRAERQGKSEDKIQQ